jgi:hypothetical protein
MLLIDRGYKAKKIGQLLPKLELSNWVEMVQQLSNKDCVERDVLAMNDIIQF